MPTIDIKKYGGKQIAIVKGKVVASGFTAREVLEKVKCLSPHLSWREVLIVSVPKGLTVVYRI